MKIEKINNYFKITLKQIEFETIFSMINPMIENLIGIGDKAYFNNEDDVVNKIKRIAVNLNDTYRKVAKENSLEIEYFSLLFIKYFESNTQIQSSEYLKYANRSLNPKEFLYNQERKGDIYRNHLFDDNNKKDVSVCLRDKELEVLNLFFIFLIELPKENKFKNRYKLLILDFILKKFFSLIFEELQDKIRLSLQENLLSYDFESFFKKYT